MSTGVAFRNTHGALAVVVEWGRRDRGDLVPRQNYRHVKKQKELSRKARQLEKQQRRAARPNGTAESAPRLEDPPGHPGDPTASSGP